MAVLFLGLYIFYGKDCHISHDDGDCGCFLLLAVHVHGVPRAFSEKFTPTILKVAD
jgi:hypothetical protein